MLLTYLLRLTLIFTNLIAGISGDIGSVRAMRGRFERRKSNVCLAECMNGRGCVGQCLTQASGADQYGRLCVQAWGATHGS